VSDSSTPLFSAAPAVPADRLLAGLNPEQAAAVTFGDGACLVLAGAGSGKTRVLTYRVAWLLAERAVPSEAVLAFTFTNRAAREMKERLRDLVGEDFERLWVGTFHGTCLRILRREAGRLRLAPGFSVFDREDQTALLARVLKELDLAGRDLKPSFFLSRISGAKNALVDPDTYEATAVAPTERQAARVYRAYQQGLAREGALDFDDLIAHAVALLERDPEARARYGGRFRHVLVDEFQDTNHAQFRLVGALASTHGNVLAVGDEDQSIYGWRGADLANVMDFERHFPGASVLRLERNYRSSGTIVEAASSVIAQNRWRRGKRLWTDREAGLPIRLFLSGDEEAEAVRLAEEVRRQTSQGRKRSECVVLFRTNAQSRALELAFRRRGIPYDLVGGVSFYERREVKDLLAYLRLAANPRDATSLLRILNVPRRGLGDQARQRLEARLAGGRETGAEALTALAQSGEIPRAGAAGARALGDLLRGLVESAAEPVDRLLESVIEATRYLDYLDESDPDGAADRRENVEELVRAGALFTAAHPAASVDEFLSEAVLVADVDRWTESEDRAVLMTAHNAKGLEFPVVMVAGCEEGTFPHWSSLGDEKELEEERRLFYVALTRAREEVIVSASSFRRRYDGGAGGELSRFVREIPPHLLISQSPPGFGTRPEGGRPGGGRSGEARHARTDHEAVGRAVYHESFGRGTVLEAEGDGPDTKFTVRFARAGVKKVIGRFLTADDD
jgi:DNA helicase-2/ATP-dependent DNA helicase PcrA